MDNLRGPKKIMPQFEFLNLTFTSPFSTTAEYYVLGIYKVEGVDQYRLMWAEMGDSRHVYVTKQSLELAYLRLKEFFGE